MNLRLRFSSLSRHFFLSRAAVDANPRRRFSISSDQSWLSSPGNPLVKWPHFEWLPPLPESSSQSSNLSQDPQPNPSFSRDDFSIIFNLFTSYSVSPGPALESELDRAGIEPSLALLQAVFQRFDSSPRLLHTVFRWAEKKPGFRPSAALFDSMVNVLAKAKEFDSAWSLILDRLDDNMYPALVSAYTFAIMIRRYNRWKMPQASIRTYKFATSLNPVCEFESGMNLFEILLDSLCKEGHVRVASEYFDRKQGLNPGWIPSIRVYNILLNGWFRSRKLKQAEQLWEDMKRNNIKASIVTYGTLVEGYCRMRREEKAIKLVHEMRREGVEPNAIVYNPIIDAFGEAGRFKEALGMLEHFLLCESGPSISTYNSLVKGFCKAGDLFGASKILKMMISREIVPTATTYNYFFKYFSKCGKIEEGMNLYTKMINLGHSPDRLTYHLLLKMLCEEERLDLAIQVSKEMRARGCDMDLATSTMLVHLLCKMHRLEDASFEFEDMIRRGIVPQFLTYQRLTDGLRRRGMTGKARKLNDIMVSVPHSTNLPNKYSGDGDFAVARTRRRSIIEKAEVMADILKTCSDPRALVKRRSSSENAIKNANQLVEDIKRRANGLQNDAGSMWYKVL